MAGMTSIYIGVSGLQSAQNGINTTTHNLANVHTEGYTRQLSFTSDKGYTNIGIGATGSMQVGLGVSTSVTSRVRDILLDAKYRKEIGRQGFYEAKYDSVTEVETIMGEIEGVQFQNTLSDLWTSMNEVAKTPDSIVARSEFVMSAETFLTRAKEIYNGLVDYQKNLNTNIQKTVNKINDLGDKINALNRQIAGIESGVENANDLRDARDLYLDELSKYINISYEEDVNHYVSVKAEGVPFVTEGGVFHIETAQLDSDKGSTYLSCVWPQLGNQEVFNLEEKISTANKNDIGSLKGYLLTRGDYAANYTDVPEVEDYDVSTAEGLNSYLDAVKVYNAKIDGCDVAKAQALFDKLINGIVTAINDVLSPTTDKVPEGVTTYTDKDGNVYNATEVKILDTTTSTGDDGKMPPEELFSRNYTDRYIEVTGDDGNTYYMYNEKNTFGSESLYTIANISMNQTIIEDYSKLPLKTSEGDNDIAKAQKLADIWNDNKMRLDPSNMAKLDYKAYYKQMVYSIGNSGDLYESMASNQNTATNQIDDERKQITGVSSEDELANMIKFQSAYNASSRYVSTIADMLEYLIERLG